MNCLRLLFFFILTNLSIQLHAADSQQISQVLSTIELPDLSGKQQRLENWKGKTILLNFWASWCTPCQYEIPHLIKYQQRYGDNDFQVVSIGLDEKRKLQNVKRSLGINYPVLVTSQQEGADLLTRISNEQQIVPYTLIITKDGDVAHRHTGEFDDSAFEFYVKPLL